MGLEQWLLVQKSTRSARHASKWRKDSREELKAIPYRDQVCMTEVLPGCMLKLVCSKAHSPRHNPGTLRCRDWHHCIPRAVVSLQARGSPRPCERHALSGGALPLILVSLTNDDVRYCGCSPRESHPVSTVERLGSRGKVLAVPILRLRALLNCGTCHDPVM